MTNAVVYQKAMPYLEAIQNKGTEIVGRMEQPLQQLDSLRHLGTAYAHQSLETIQNAITTTSEALNHATNNIGPYLYNAAVELPGQLSEVGLSTVQPDECGWDCSQDIGLIGIQGCAGGFAIFVIGYFGLKKLGEYLRKDDAPSGNRPMPPTVARRR